MAMLIPDLEVITDSCRSAHDAFQYRPRVIDENDRVLWHSDVITYSETSALRIAEDAVEALCYQIRHQIQLKFGS